MSNPNPKFRGLKLPTEMFEACAQIIKECPECKWGSVADFVRDAIRHYEYWKRHVCK